MNENRPADRDGQVFESGNAIFVEFDGDADTTIRPCPIPLRPTSDVPKEPRTLTVEFDGGEEDLTVRPISPELLEKIRRFKPRV